MRRWLLFPFLLLVLAQTDLRAQEGVPPEELRALLDRAVESRFMGDAQRVLAERLDAAGVQYLLEVAADDADPARRQAATRLYEWLITNPSERRTVLRRTFLAQAAHQRARVRLLVHRSIILCVDEPELCAEAPALVLEGWADTDADVRHTAVLTALALHGPDRRGCIDFGPRPVPFDVRPHAAALERLLLRDPDPRVRTAALSGLAWCGRSTRLPALLEYLSLADRRTELDLLRPAVVEFFTFPADGHPGVAETDVDAGAALGEAWRALTALREGTELQRRNALVTLLALAVDLKRPPQLELLREVMTFVEEDGLGRRCLTEADARLILEAWERHELVDDVPDFFHFWLLDALRPLLRSE